VSFINVHSSFSDLPSVYIDEWGNARISTYCRGDSAPFMDLKLGVSAFQQAVQILTEIEFHKIPYQPNYEYIMVNGKKTLSLIRETHQSRYHVTFNEKGPWSMHSVQFDKSSPSKSVGAVEKLITNLIKGHEGKLCKPQN